jgi:hypothetical protein
MEYKEYGCNVNEKPDDGWVEFCVEHNDFMFYVYIDKDNYDVQLEETLGLIEELTDDPGGSYVEVVDWDADICSFGTYMEYNTNSIYELDGSFWWVLNEYGDTRFEISNECFGVYAPISEIENMEYMIFADYDEMLESLCPELYETLENANALFSFDSENYLDDGNVYELDDGTLVVIIG